MSNKNLKYIPIVIIVSLIVIFVSLKMSNHILLFPFWLSALLYFIALLVAFYFAKKWNIFSSDKEEDKKTVSFFNGLLAVLLAFVILNIFRLPLNMMIKQQSKQNELITQTCPITYYSLKLKKQKKRITFTLNDKSIRMKLNPNEFAKLKTIQASQKFIQLQIRKSILGTYVVEEYEVK